MFKNYKRSSGQLTKDGKWVVLTECEKKNGDFIHKCDGAILGKEITLSNRDGVGSFSGSGKTVCILVPFCPNCEREPKNGTCGPLPRDLHIVS